MTVAEEPRHFFRVANLYDDWIQRVRSNENPLGAVRLHEQAETLRTALQKRDHSAQEDALGAIMRLDDYDTFYDAVGAFLSANND